MLASDAVPVADIPRHMMNDTNTAAPHSISKFYKPDLPGSQDSFISQVSSSFSVPALVSSSSNISSTSTTTDAELASSSTSYPPSSQTQPSDLGIPPSPIQTQIHGHNVQPASPRIDTGSVLRTGDTAASPMSLDSPLPAQGSKRTASGAVKSTSLTVDSGVVPAGTHQSHKRNKSTESSSNPRIGELSAQLRTRLSYAMVKVQNGWEKKSLEDLEDETSQRGSPISAPGRTEGTRPSFDSPRDMNRPRRPSGVSENSDQMMLSPGQRSPSELSRALPTTSSSFWRSAARPPTTISGRAGHDPVTVNGVVLAPAAEIGPRRKRRSSASHPPPSLLGSNQRKHYSDIGATPRTPATAPRPGILRMPSQQAEKDAVDTLLFMSSPNNSGRVPHNSMAHPRHLGPLKPEAPERRVMFESHTPKDRPDDGRQLSHAHGGPAGMYRQTPSGR